MRNFIGLCVITALTLSLAACGGMKVPGVEVPGIELPSAKTTEVELSLANVCPKCTPETHSTLNPFTEPVKFTQFEVESVDTFVENANNVYGSVLVVEKLVEVSKTIAGGGTVAGFASGDEAMSLAKAMLDTATTDIPNLITQGEALVTSVPGELAADPIKMTIADQAVTEITTAVGRLKDAQGKLTGLATAFAE